MCLEAWEERGALGRHPVKKKKKKKRKGQVKDSAVKRHNRDQDNSPAGKFMQATLTLAGQVK